MKKFNSHNGAPLNENNSKKPSRRRFLKFSATSGAAIAAGSTLGLAPTAAVADDFSSRNRDRALRGQNRAVTSASLKIHGAKKSLYHTLRLPDQKDNNDERRYRQDRFYASFTKTLPCNQFGEVDPRAFRKMRRALRSGKQHHFDNIPLASGSTRTLEDPQGAFRFEASGLDSHATRINPSLKFRSAELAGQQGEVYWQALTRDVPFIDYENDSLIAAAVDDLNAFSKTPGAVNNSGKISADHLFRGETPGDLVGPYVSQFLLRPFNWGPVSITQKYSTPVAKSDFMVDVPNWLNVQRGGVAETVGATETKYIYNNRALAEAVHNDALYQYYLHATMILLDGIPDIDINGANKFDLGNTNNQGVFTSLGGLKASLIDLVSKSAHTALSGAWFQKWRVHRFLRPEALGGRIHFHKTGQRNYELHSDILDSDAIQRTFAANGTYLLPMAFTEGSPTHPSYVAGHACVAGACTTILKAFFNEDFVLSDNVQADANGDSLIAYNGELTLGGEVNKLANNVSIGRDAAGVHYRQDGIQGLSCGEQQAIALLAEATKLNEATFSRGFTFSKFDGSTITIRDGKVF